MARATRSGKSETGRRSGGAVAAPVDGIMVTSKNIQISASELAKMTLGDMLRLEVKILVAGHPVTFKEEIYSGNVACALGDRAKVMMYPFPVTLQANDFLGKLHRTATEIRT